MTTLRAIQSTINSKSFLTPQQSICIKGGTDEDGEGEVLRRKRKPASQMGNATGGGTHNTNNNKF